MNKNAKTWLQFLGIIVITIVIALTSIFNPWIENAMTDMQQQILDIAHSVREGYLAYVELDGNYGPVIYEFYGLGYLLTETHIVHFIMELVILFFSVMFMFKTAKLYTSEVFALVCTAFITIIGWGSLTSSGAEEFMFFIFTLTAYHVARQLKYGYLSYHTYLMAIDFGIMFFIQPGYSIIWMVLIVFFAIMFKLIGLEGKEYRSYFFSILEGIITVGIPMGLYLWYFRNGSAFLQKVVTYNFSNLGNFAEGFRTIIATPWSIMIGLLLVVIIIKAVMGDSILDLCCWLGFIAVAVVVISIQGDVNSHSVQLLKALYIVPMASAFSFIDKPLGLSVEERDF